MPRATKRGLGGIKISRWREQLAEPALGVRYEQLESAPEPVLRQICSHMKFPWEAGLLGER